MRYFQFIALAVFMWPSLASAQQRAPDPAAPYVQVVDAQTIQIAYKRWQVKGYHAPRIEGARCPEERARGLQASARLEILFKTGKIDVVPEGRLDRWRGLAKVTVDGRDVGEILIAEKLAVKDGVQEWWGCPPKKAVPRKPVPPTKVGCRGLTEAKCIRTSGCKWVKHAAKEDKHGRPLKDYCRRLG